MHTSQLVADAVSAYNSIFQRVERGRETTPSSEIALVEHREGRVRISDIVDGEQDTLDVQVVRVAPRRRRSRPYMLDAFLRGE